MLCKIYALSCCAGLLSKVLVKAVVVTLGYIPGPAILVYNTSHIITNTTILFFAIGLNSQECTSHQTMSKHRHDHC